MKRPNPIIGELGHFDSINAYPTIGLRSMILGDEQSHNQRWQRG